MIFKVLGSGSKGNGYVLDDGKDILVIECGVPMKDLLPAIDFQIARVKGCIVSHSHGDHAGYIGQYEKRGRTICKPYENPSVERNTYQIGSFKVQTFWLVHDVDCYGFLITHPDMGKLLYATDTEYIKYSFSNLNHIIIEANYAFDIMDDDVIDPTKRDHVLRGHMELSTTMRFLSKNCNENTRNVILAHLSEVNSDRDRFLSEVQGIVSCPVCIAQKGMVLSLDL